MPILIRGETGTGKEQMARHAHAASRRTGSFVAVNCAALPDSLIEAELFGYTEGAFTGARKGGSQGLFREADGGTLFLDEIGDMPVTLQAVLLRFRDDWTVRPVGGSKREVDVLLVSATNADLDDAIANGRFRSDLLFRLNTLEVTLLPLRERSDFADIARHLMHKIDPSIALSEAAVQRLAQRSWVGNIRELRNALARLSLSETGPVIDAVDIDAVVGLGSPERIASKITMDTSTPADLHEIQRALVLTTFAETGTTSAGLRGGSASRATPSIALCAASRADPERGKGSIHPREAKMFEPENSLEALMQAAGRDPAIVPRFYRALLAAEIYVLTPEAPIEPGQSRSLARQERIDVASVEFQGLTWLPAFTSRKRISDYLKQPEACLGAAARDLFTMLPGANFWFNPLSECQKPMPASETALLMGASGARFPRPRNL